MPLPKIPSRKSYRSTCKSIGRSNFLQILKQTSTAGVAVSPFSPILRHWDRECDSANPSFKLHHEITAIDAVFGREGAKTSQQLHPTRKGERTIPFLHGIGKKPCGAAQQGRYVIRRHQQKPWNSTEKRGQMVQGRLPHCWLQPQDCGHSDGGWFGCLDQ